MKGFHDPIIAEVRRNRAKLFEMYGGIEGLHKHQDEERPQLEKEGWRFATDEEIATLQCRHDKAEVGVVQGPPGAVLSLCPTPARKGAIESS